MVNLFKRYKKKSEKDQSQVTQIKAVYVMAFTPSKLEGPALMGVGKIAGDMLKGKNANFRLLEEQLTNSKTPMHFANLEYNAIMHTPQTMQTTLGGWLKNQYQIAFRPVIGKNFFPHGMKDPQGRDNFVLFYFDFK
jgi:hypothetical protein